MFNFEILWMNTFGWNFLIFETGANLNNSRILIILIQKIYLSVVLLKLKYVFCKFEFNNLNIQDHFDQKYTEFLQIFIRITKFDNSQTHNIKGCKSSLSSFSLKVLYSTFVNIILIMRLLSFWLEYVVWPISAWENNWVLQWQFTYVPLNVLDLANRSNTFYWILHHLLSHL